MTQELANSIIANSTRCTQATLQAFGIEGYPLLGSGCLEFMTRRGFKLERVMFPNSLDVTMKWLNSVRFSKGSYLINTPRHAMALIDGILVDTENKGFDNRKVLFIWEVIK
jgi:hypothetical protein